jgi:eukaryotic-like serine/threonine-protein kinase
MLTGRCPFVEPTAILLLARHVQAPPPRLVDVAPSLAATPGIDALESVVARLLAKAPGDRPPNAAACIAELDAAAAALAGRAVPRGDRNAASTMDLDAPRAPLPSLFMPSPSEGLAPPRKRTGAIIAIAIAAIAVVAGVIVAAVAHHGRPSHALAPTPDARPSISDAAAVAVADADAVPDAAAPVDAGVAAVPVALAPATSPAAAHIAAAEAARASGNHIKQLTEADLAVRKDPHNAEARFLLGDALITGGDIQNGCQYLRSVKRLAKARAALAAAGCPSR